MNANAGQPVDHRAYRLTSIDMLRGLVIIIMALDHTRDFFMAGATKDPMSDPNASVLLFFTRWITHFCAPVFVFLAGTSAGLMGARKTPADLAKFLLTRGLWLIAVEVLLISTAITLSPGGIEQLGGKTLVFMQVIWVIGAGMVLLAALQYLDPVAMLLVEEPENGLHPARIADVMKILREISRTTQVVLATHSPLVINEMRGDEVTLVTRDPDQGTQVRRLSDTPNFAERSKVYALGELWLSYANGVDEAPLLADGKAT